MTWRNSAWHGKFIWFLLGILGMFVVIAITMLRDDTVSGFSLWAGLLSLAACAALIAVMYNWITIRTGEVRIGYFPFYRRTLRTSEIRSLTIVDIKPLQEFGGWGVRGLAKSRHGLLLGGHPARGLRFETTDDRRYIVTFDDLDPIVAALAEQGCTLSAGIGEDVSGKV